MYRLSQTREAQAATAIRTRRPRASTYRASNVAKRSSQNEKTASLQAQRETKKSGKERSVAREPSASHRRATPIRRNHQAATTTVPPNAAALTNRAASGTSPGPSPTRAIAAGKKGGHMK